MKRVLVIGCAGAGKSTFSLRLGKALGLPVIHMDAYFWKPGWILPKGEEWRKTVASLCLGDAWVMDGNYNSTLEFRMQRADAVFFLHLPTFVCLKNVVRRVLTKKRPDEIPGCAERIELQFLRYILAFNRKDAPENLRLLEEKGHGKEIRIFRSLRQADHYLKEIETTLPK